jgi:hypothetical protein
VRPVSLPNGRIPLREPPCPGRQVGEGVSPTLDAQPLLNSDFSFVNELGHLPSSTSAIICQNCSIVAPVRRAVNSRRAVSYKCARPLPE